MSTYTCPHCGQHDLSTQRRHNCPKLPSLSIPLGPPRSMDPCANEYIARLTRELEEARERARAITTAARRVVETAYPPSGGFQRVHRSAIEDLRRAVGADPGDRSERQWELDPPSVAHLIRLEVGRTGQSSYPEIEGLLRTAADQLDYLARELEAVRERERALREALVEVAIPLEAFWMVMHDSKLLSAEMREAVQKALGIVRRAVGATTVREGGE